MNFKCEMKDIIACIVIVGAFILKFKGADGIVSICLISVVAFYFGLKIPTGGSAVSVASCTTADKKEPTIT